jgi:Tol biopolymer transport system component
MRKVLWVLLLMGCAVCARASDNNLLVNTGDGSLIIVHPDGSQELIAKDAGGAAFSPDGRYLVYVASHMRALPSGDWSCDCKLMVMNMATHTTNELLDLPAGTSFGQVGWSPDGNVIAYEIIVRVNGNEKSHDLILAPFPPDHGSPRNLGQWYQGFSFAPDGKRIVHAVNHPAKGLEAVDIDSGSRTLLHKAEDVVWEAQFSPDGKYIAYMQTTKQAQQATPKDNDDEPDCGAPDNQLRLYSLADGSDVPILIPQAPPSLFHFAWSPDSKRLALELGSQECDYPPGTSTIFVSSIDLKSQTKISSVSPSIEPQFSPDGSAIAFVDFLHVPNRLLEYDFASGTSHVIRQARPKENGYQLVAWK